MNAPARSDQSPRSNNSKPRAREQIELDRQRVLYGWAGAGGSGEVYGVALVTDPTQLAEAAAELSRGDVPTRYVILRVAESTDQFDNTDRARSLRQLIDTSGYLSRAPEAGEYEALRNAARELAALRQQEREEERERGRRGQ
jgi:hypothetical protein